MLKGAQPMKSLSKLMLIMSVLGGGGLDHWKVLILQTQNLPLVETSFNNFFLVKNKEMSFWLFQAKTSAKCFLMCGFALAISCFLFCIHAQNFFLLCELFVIL
jgi:hypothetical protein